MFNSLSGKVEVFKLNEKEDKISMYVCGPTVYSEPHIGNIRSIAVYDLIYRVIRHVYGDKKIVYVRNVTDVDDKIIKIAKDNNLLPSDIAKLAYGQFKKSCEYIHTLEPTHEPKATEYIKKMTDYILKMLDLKIAYKKDGNVMFGIDKYNQFIKVANAKNPNKQMSLYGELSGRVDKSSTNVHVRDISKTEKADERDFVLWKPEVKPETNFASKKTTDNKRDRLNNTIQHSNNSQVSNEWGWNEGLGYGRPGWHTECVAMSNEYFSNGVDIHGGGVDLKFPHHENELAQVQCLNVNRQFVRYWVHNGALLICGKKMSKSQGNVITVEQLRKVGFTGSTLKYFLLSSCYRSPLNVSVDGLLSCYGVVKRMVTAMGELDMQKINKHDDFKLIEEEDVKYLLNDFNSPKYLANMCISLQEAEKALSTVNHLKEETSKPLYKLFQMGCLIGLWTKNSLKDDLTLLLSAKLTLDNKKILQNKKIEDIKIDNVTISKCDKHNSITNDVVKMVIRRTFKREEGNFADADKIRHEIEEKGFSVIDQIDKKRQISVTIISTMVTYNIAYDKGITAVEDKVRVGDFVIIKIGTKIGKNTVIGDYAKVGCFVNIGEGVKVGKNVTIGSFANIKDNQVIKNNTVIPEFYSF